jgi:hypothetical protein
LRPFSISSLNSAAGISSEKDRLLEEISAFIVERKLTARKLAVLKPGIYPNKLSLLHDQDRSACGLETIQEIVEAIESGVLDGGMRRRRDQNPQDRDPIAEAVKEDPLSQVARSLRQMPTAQIHAKFPNLGKHALSNIRNEKPGFGWDRLNTIAVRLGIDVAAIWSKLYQPQKVAA